VRFLSPSDDLVRHPHDAGRTVRPAARRERSPAVAKFLFVYRNSSESYGTMSPEVMEQMLRKWNAWITEGLRKGWMLDAGDDPPLRLQPVAAEKVVTDGPFIELKEIVGGFSIVQADTLDAAAELAKGSPIFLRGGSVEVRPLAGFTTGR
jgi:hypothetical protein